MKALAAGGAFAVWAVCANPEERPRAAQGPHLPPEKSLPIRQKECSSPGPNHFRPVTALDQNPGHDPDKVFDLLVDRRRRHGATIALEGRAPKASSGGCWWRASDIASGTSRPQPPSCCMARALFWSGRSKPLICAGCRLMCAKLLAASAGHWLAGRCRSWPAPGAAAAQPAKPAGQPPYYGAAWRVYDLLAAPAARSAPAPAWLAPVRF